jgi:murein DD-endopeptidase MepM/ murein hydrolase activator NlpD
VVSSTADRINLEGATVPTIRALRRSYGLTLVDLALATGIPARTLGRIEYGLAQLDPDTRRRLACTFDLPAELLRPGTWPVAPPASDRDSFARLRRAAPSLIVMLLSALLVSPPPPGPYLPSDLARSIHPANRPWLLRRAPARPIGQPPALPTASPMPMASTPRSLNAAAPPTPTSRLAADGPHGCPVAAQGRHIVITQGYGEGMHAPPEVWGGIDLAIDADGDGQPEPDSTRGVAVVATHSGVARVYPGSWPGGNYVRIEDERAGWRTAYAHLASIAVVDGQALASGAPIGTIGSTGLATGPHLHYEVWHGTQNVDPTPLIACSG